MPSMSETKSGEESEEEPAGNKQEDIKKLIPKFQKFQNYGNLFFRARI